MADVMKEIAMKEKKNVYLYGSLSEETITTSGRTINLNHSGGVLLVS